MAAPAVDAILAGISKALEAHDMPAVAGLIGLLSTVDPESAQTILAAIRVSNATRTPTPAQEATP